MWGCLRSAFSPQYPNVLILWIDEIPMQTGRDNIFTSNTYQAYRVVSTDSTSFAAE